MRKGVKHMREKIKEILITIKNIDETKYDKLKKVLNTSNNIENKYISVGISVSVDDDLNWWNKTTFNKYRINHVNYINIDELKNDTNFSDYININHDEKNYLPIEYGISNTSSTDDSINLKLSESLNPEEEFPPLTLIFLVSKKLVKKIHRK